MGPGTVPRASEGFLGVVGRPRPIVRVDSSPVAPDSGPTVCVEWTSTLATSDRLHAYVHADGSLVASHASHVHVRVDYVTSYSDAVHVFVHVDVCFFDDYVDHVFVCVDVEAGTASAVLPRSRSELGVALVECYVDYVVFNVDDVIPNLATIFGVRQLAHRFAMARLRRPPADFESVISIEA